ncbi:Oxygen sensor histidine kinase NreB [Geobacter sulfurreducens]|nr:Oxygen sensor histidine kinase NreB [Geobacter sulfurreducens]
MIHRHLQHSPFPVLLVEPQGRIVQASPASLEFLGIDSRHSAPRALVDIMHAEQCEAVLRAGAALTDTGFWEGECSLIGRDGQPVRAFLRVARAGDDRLVMYLRDSAGRSRSEELLRIRLQLSERARCESLDELLRSALDAAERLTDSRIGYLHVVAPDREQASLQAWSSNTLATMCRVRGEKEHHPTRRAGIWGDCCRERTAMIHNDYAGLPHKKELPEGHPPIVRVMGVPIIHGDKVLAIIGVGNKATEYIREDADALHELASMIMDLVERKQAEAQLLASEKRFRTVFEQAAVGVALVDPLTGRFVRVNAKYGDIVGYSPEAMLTMGFQELTHPDDLAVDLECISRLLRGEVRTFTREKRYLHRNGCNVWVRLTVSPLWAEGEEPSFNIAIVEDITARKAAEAALREAKEQLELRVRERTADLEQANRALQEEVAARSRIEESLRRANERVTGILESLSDGFAAWDCGWRYTYVNAAAERILGRRREELLGRDMRTLFPDFHTTPFLHRCRQAMDGQTAVSFEEYCVSLGMWIEVRAFPSAGGGAAFFRDITGNKRAENELTVVKDRLAVELAAMTRLHRIATLFVREDGIGAVLEEIIEAAIAITGADMGNLQLLDASGALKIVAHRGFGAPFLDFFSTVRDGCACCGTALRLGTRMVIEDVTQSPVFAGTPALEVMLDAGARAVQSTPLVSSSGPLLGMLSTHYRSPRRPDERDLRLLDLLARLSTDIIERTRAKEALRDSESRFRRLIQMAPLPLCCADVSGTLLYVNDRFTRLFGYAPEDIPTQEEWWSRVYPDGRCRRETVDSWQASVQRVPHGAGDIEPAEFRVECKNGDIRLVEVSGITIEGTVLATFIDITERRLAEDELHRHRELLEELVHQRTAELKLRNMELATEIAERRRAEAALRCYTRRLTEMEEDLRKKLAAELHDEIGRDLTALNLNFTVIGNRVVQEPDGNLRARIEDTERLIEDISRTVRGLTAKLRPPVLDDYGLPAALRWHADLFSRRTGIEVTVQVADSIPRMPAEKEIALFRIVQEALTNCSKHANAGNVKVFLDHGDGRVRLSVVDDGTGFAIESASPTPAGSGWGLTIMRERAELIGGTFRLDTAPGKGTVLTVEIDEDS